MSADELPEGLRAELRACQNALTREAPLRLMMLTSMNDWASADYNSRSAAGLRTSYFSPESVVATRDVAPRFFTAMQVFG